jgi:hypothetical protein
MKERDHWEELEENVVQYLMTLKEMGRKDVGRAHVDQDRDH